MRITGINNNANSVRVYDCGTRFTKSGLLAYARNVNAAKYADIGTDKSTLTHAIDGGAMSIRHKKPERKEHTLFITQQMPWNNDELSDCEWLHNIIAIGGRDTCEFNEGDYCELYARIKGGIISGDMEYEIENCIGDCGYKNATELINDYLGVNANTRQVGKMKKILKKYKEDRYYSDEDLIADVMTVFTPHKWASTSIHGCVQRDWAYIVYPTDIYNQQSIDEFEAYYFGMYMDYKATFEEEDVWYTFCDFEGEDAIIRAISEDFGTSKVKYFSYY